eukprot:CAMPEP_0172928274 /NCGR_PEP_ID=MMETSP1075-20121228/217896_1 /TAXON_ID=2916 /ORGANISM="Ceratium fusus, Strain PA161109" /LENGTH=86 /DNA_ID=CAMNT_0013789557 /DNA_START=504 /DNA_END=764 /DNA_ORIENTATION=-
MGMYISFPSLCSLDISPTRTSSIHVDSGDGGGTNYHNASSSLASRYPDSSSAMLHNVGMRMSSISTSNRKPQSARASTKMGMRLVV